MTKQLSFLDDAGPRFCDGQLELPIVRSNDPATSQQAADEVARKIGDLHYQVRDYIRDAGEPLTSREVAEGMKRAGCELEVETIRKRVGEAERLGLLRDIGARICRITGKAASAFDDAED